MIFKVPANPNHSMIYLTAMKNKLRYRIQKSRDVLSCLFSIGR